VSPVAMEPARRHRRLQRGRRSLHPLHRLAEPPRRAPGDVAHLARSGEPDPRHLRPTSAADSDSKGNPFPDDALVLWASRRIRRPVKWVATRSESMLTDHCGRETVYYGELALNEEGKILALRARCCCPAGRLFRGRGPGPGAFAVRFIPEAYDIQTMHITSQGLFTNTSQCGPVPPVPAVPRRRISPNGLIEHAARTLDMDPAESGAAILFGPRSCLCDATALELRQRRVRAPDGSMH